MQLQRSFMELKESFGRKVLTQHLRKDAAKCDFADPRRLLKTESDELDSGRLMHQTLSVSAHDFTQASAYTSRAPLPFRNFATDHAEAPDWYRSSMMRMLLSCTDSSI